MVLNSISPLYSCVISCNISSYHMTFFFSLIDFTSYLENTIPRPSIQSSIQFSIEYPNQDNWKWIIFSYSISRYIHKQICIPDMYQDWNFDNMHCHIMFIVPSTYSTVFILVYTYRKSIPLSLEEGRAFQEWYLFYWAFLYSFRNHDVSTNMYSRCSYVRVPSHYQNRYWTIPIT